ncbi:MAG TPA: iron-sulfur cluster assembly scaffold protein [Planctomycetota bacterium]|nr:iron-sulfur cluster assembly scaffold protein [Planctomycetota bacterium]
MPTMDYSAKVAEHFLRPKKLGTLTEKDIDPLSEKLLAGDSGNIARGDAIRVTLRVRASDERILDARFQNFGTGMPIASGSCFCSMIVGKTLDEALRVSAEDLDRELDGLPELRHRRMVLVLDAFDNALRKYRGQPPRKKSAPGEPLVCYCFQISENSVERAIRLRGLKTIEELANATKAGAGCHTCHPDLDAILKRCARGEYRVHISPQEYEASRRIAGTPPPSVEELAKNPPAPPRSSALLPAVTARDRSAAVAPDGFVYPVTSPVVEAVKTKAPEKAKTPRKPWPEMSEKEKLERIEEVLENDLRPAIRADGGDIRLVGLDGERVRVTLHGHCEGCHSALSTLKHGVEKHLRDAVWLELEVEEVIQF